MENAKAIAGSSSDGKGVIAVEVETLLTAWLSLNEGPEKSKIEAVLRNSNQVDPQIFSLPGEQQGTVPASPTPTPGPADGGTRPRDKNFGSAKSGTAVPNSKNRGKNIPIEMDISSPDDTGGNPADQLGTVHNTIIPLHNEIAQNQLGGTHQGDNFQSILNSPPLNNHTTANAAGPVNFTSSPIIQNTGPPLIPSPTKVSGQAELPKSISIPLKSGPVILNKFNSAAGPTPTLNLNLTPSHNPSPTTHEIFLNLGLIHQGSMNDPIPISPSPPASLTEPMMRDPISSLQALGGVKGYPLLPKEEPRYDPMEEEPSEYFSENEVQGEPASGNGSPDQPPGFEQLWAAVAAAAPADYHPTFSAEQVGSNSHNSPVPSYSPYTTESGKRRFEDELRTIREEFDREDLLEQERVYQSALTNPEQAHLSPEQEEAMVPLVAVHVGGIEDQVEGAEQAGGLEDQPLAPIIAPAVPLVEQTPLRRSRRILEQGGNATKHYTPKKTRVARSPMAKKVTPKSLDPKRKEQLIRALQENALVDCPIQQQQMAEIDQLCGLRRGLDQGNSSTARRNLQGALEAEPVEDLEEESVLGAFDFDSGEDLSDGEGRGEESH